MAAYLCLIALIFVDDQLVVDLLYFAVDPRLRVEKDRRRALIDLLPDNWKRSHEKNLLPALVATARRSAAPLSPTP